MSAKELDSFPWRAPSILGLKFSFLSFSTRFLIALSFSDINFSWSSLDSLYFSPRLVRSFCISPIELFSSFKASFNSLSAFSRYVIVRLSSGLFCFFSIRDFWSEDFSSWFFLSLFSNSITDFSSFWFSLFSAWEFSFASSWAFFSSSAFFISWALFSASAFSFSSWAFFSSSAFSFSSWSFFSSSAFLASSLAFFFSSASFFAFSSACLFSSLYALRLFKSFAKKLVSYTFTLSLFTRANISPSFLTFHFPSSSFSNRL